MAPVRICWIGGSHPRHLYYLNKIHSEFAVEGIIIENREHMIPQPPEGINEHDRDNFIRHFEARENSEQHYFGTQNVPDCRKLEVTDKTVNSLESVDFVQSIQPDLVLIFGAGLIKEPLFSALPHYTINFHLGISPRYRGAATLFWPFYFMEPAYAGSTFHHIVDTPDAGDVIHQVTPKLDPKDGIHDVACKTVVESAEDALKLLEIFQQQRTWNTHKQQSTGKNFLNSDFKPEHLRVNYDLFGDQMAEKYLDGRLKSKVPWLFRQF